MVKDGSPHTLSGDISLLLQKCCVVSRILLDDSLSERMVEATCAQFARPVVFCLANQTARARSGTTMVELKAEMEDEIHTLMYRSNLELPIINNELTSLF